MTPSRPPQNYAFSRRYSVFVLRVCGSWKYEWYSRYLQTQQLFHSSYCVVPLRGRTRENDGRAHLILWPHERIAIHVCSSCVRIDVYVHVNTYVALVLRDYSSSSSQAHHHMCDILFIYMANARLARRRPNTTLYDHGWNYDDNLWSPEVCGFPPSLLAAASSRRYVRCWGLATFKPNKVMYVHRSISHVILSWACRNTHGRKHLVVVKLRIINNKYNILWSMRVMNGKQGTRREGKSITSGV